MKRHFGGKLTRSFVGAGVTLSEVEYRLLTELVAALPDHLRSIVESQFDSYTIVQRDGDGCALNFWRKKFLRGTTRKGIPMLDMSIPEARLIRITAILNEEEKPVHASLVAVSGRVFCIALSRPVHSYSHCTKLRVTKVTEAWRSNFPRKNRSGEQDAAEQPSTAGESK